MLVPSDSGLKEKAVSHQVLEKLDVDGRYVRFWPWVSRHIYDLLPGLYHYPLNLARALDSMDDDAEATKMFAITEIITNCATAILTHNTTYKQHSERAHVTVIEVFFIWVIHYLPILHPCTPGQAFRYSHYLYPDISHSDLTTLMDAMFVHPNIVLISKRRLVPAVNYINHAIEQGGLLTNVKEPIVLPVNLYQNNSPDEESGKSEKYIYTDADVVALVNAWTANQRAD
jgi:hypothetical protein